MKRRAAVRGIFIFSFLSTIGYTGYQFNSRFKKPPLGRLDDLEPLINAIADIIIPDTNSPGAGSAKVGNFIINMIKNCTTRQSQNNFIAGLEETEKLSIHNYKLPFVECKTEQKINILNTLNVNHEDKNTLISKVKTKLLGQSYISLLKEYTTKGYCTSKVGATIGLAYNPVPGKYNGCVPLGKNQKAWATK